MEKKYTYLFIYLLETSPRGLDHLFVCVVKYNFLWFVIFFGILCFIINNSFYKPSPSFLRETPSC